MSLKATLASIRVAPAWMFLSFQSGSMVDIGAAVGRQELTFSVLDPKQKPPSLEIVEVDASPSVSDFSILTQVCAPILRVTSPATRLLSLPGSSVLLLVTPNLTWSPNQ